MDQTENRPSEAPFYVARTWLQLCEVWFLWRLWSLQVAEIMKSKRSSWLYGLACHAIQ